MARLDALYHSVAAEPVDLGDLSNLEEIVKDLCAAVSAQLAEINVDGEAEVVLRAVIGLYAGADAANRRAIRQLFDRYTSFRWAARLPPGCDTPEQFRSKLICLSMRDQGADPRDEILAVQDLCGHARRLGIDVDAIVAEVAEMSSDLDRYGFGSMRRIILRYGGSQRVPPDRSGVDRRRARWWARRHGDQHR